MLRHLAYVSSASELFGEDELAELLRRSRAADERDGITGMLLHRDGDFMATVEGPAAAIEDLQRRLAHDPRHHGMLVLLDGERAERLFHGWSMGFHRIAAGEPLDEPGFSEFLDTPLSAEVFGADPATSQRLLLTFRRVANRA